MRVRLVGVFTLLAAICMICFAVGIGMALASSRTQSMVIDRIQIANHFAALSAADPAHLAGEAQTHFERTGDGVLVIAGSGRVLVDVEVDRHDARIIEVSDNAHRFVPPETLFPWSTDSMVVGQPIGTGQQAGGVVVIAISTTATRSGITDSWIQLACVTVTALLAFGGVALAVSGWILRPVTKLRRDVEALTSTLPVRCAEPSGPRTRSQGPREIVELAVAVAAVTTAVADLAAAERRLVVDTAHSLRNPLAALAVRLQALQPMIAQDHAAATFSGVVREVDRLSELLDGLLGTAVADAAKARAAVSTCDAVAVARDRVDAWREAFLRADMTLTLEACDETARAGVPASVLAQIIDVALSNSARYAGSDAQTTIAVGYESDSVVVSVRDDGVGVSPDELDQLTTRFFRGTQAAAGGSGLGLPIAATMVAQYGGLFFVEIAEPCGLVVTASFRAGDPAAGNLTSR
ncbi:sensor histidine kinase [Nocardia salmonicida]|uniref:sensor histidine kinase n=1 Tax=Nocardia salmonicida TaxID=53431 RepID=UPI0036CB58B5